MVWVPLSYTPVAFAVEAEYLLPKSNLKDLNSRRDSNRLQTLVSSNLNCEGENCLIYTHKIM